MVNYSDPAVVELDACAYGLCGNARVFGELADSNRQLQL